MKKVKAYKVFDENMQCRGFQYKLGESYTIEGNLEVCSNGFHACEKLLDCFNYYSFSPRNKIALVILSGEIQKKEDKLCAETIQIKKMISWEEALKMCNSGDYNSGYRNSGDYNSGDYNSGDYNSGNRNSGYYNSGAYNSGDYNSGDYNSGNGNSGDYNSGNRNSGYRNSGDYNSGDYNSGDYNSGYYNSGAYNSGDYNSGDYNSGNGNSGDYNSGNRNSGYLNSNNSDKIRVFNKWIDSSIEIDFPDFFYFNLTVFISHDTATSEEKEKYKKEIETCGGFLKTLEYKEAWRLSYEKASDADKAKVKNIPGFDSDIFYEITGIRI